MSSQGRRQIKETMLQQKKKVEELRAPYMAYATRTMEAAMPDTQNIFYTCMGYNIDQYRKFGAELFAAWCGQAQREIERPAADAVAEHVRGMVKTNTIGDWGLFAGISAYVFRRWTRNQNAKMVGLQRYWAPALQICWFGFLGFGVVAPAFHMVNDMMWVSRMRKDPRVSTLQHELKDRQTTNGLSGSGGEANGSSYGWNDQSRSQYGATPGQGESRSQIQEQATAWGQADTENQNKAGWSQSSSGQPIQENSAWDDASPLAPAAQAEPASRPGESSWDRLRRNAGVSRQQSSQPPQGRQPPPSQGGWGENTDTSAQFGASSRTSRDDYSYSSADFEKSSSKDQAQQDFDRLLDRERQGVDQENKKWR